MSMKTILRGLVVALSAVLGLNAWADKVIAINFNSTATSNTGGGDAYKIADGETMNVIDYTIPFAGWTQLEGASSSSAVTSLTEYDTEAQTTKEISGVSLTWSSANTWAWRNDTIQSEATYKYLEGYLDDGGSGAKVNISGIPYENGYDVIVFMIDDGTAKVASPTINGKMYSYVDDAVKVVTTATNWGAGQQTTAAYGKNALRIAKQSGDLVIDSPRRGGRGAIAAIVLVEAEATIKNVECGDAYSISSAKGFTEDIVNLKLNAGATLTLDEAPARDFNIVSEGKVLVKGSALSAENLAKLANKTAGYIFRIEGDLSDGTTLAFGAGMYSFENAKITTAYGADYKILVQDGETFHLAETNQQDGRTSVSLDIRGGDVTIGKTGGYGSYWYGSGNATTYSQSGGTVTCTINGTGTSGSGSGLLLGWSNALASMNVSGGTFSVPNSSLNFWSTSTTLNISGGTVKAKGVFQGSGSGHKIVLSSDGSFELGSIGWTTIPLTLNGGTFKAYENTTMAGPITMGGAANIEVPADVELTLTGSVTGDGAITKKGEGTLKIANTNHGSFGAIEAGKIQIVATANEIADGEIQIPTSQTSYAEGVIEVVNAQGENILDSAAIESGVLKLVLLSQSIKATSNVSDWNPEWTGAVSVKNDDPENAMTMTVNAAFPAGVTTVNIFGKVDIVYTEGASAESTVTIATQSGAAVSVTGAIANTITVPSGATLITKGETSSAGKISNSGTVEVVDGTLTLSAGTLGGTITIDKGATIKFAKDHAIGNTVVLNVYGTLDLTGATWFDSNSAPGNVLNLFAGSKIVGGNCGMVMTGGYSNTINIKQYADADVNYVDFGVTYHTSSYGAGYSTTFAIENDASKPKVGLKITKPFQRNGSVVVSGTHIQGLYLDCSKEVKLGNNNRCLHGDITIKSGTTLVMQGGDMIPYQATNDFVLNLEGTLACGATRQTISAEGGNNILNLNGGTISGTGAANGGYTSILDVFQDQLITLSGTSTISGPIGFRNATTTTLQAAEGSETAVLKLTGGVVGNANAKIKLTECTSLVVSEALAEGKVITDVQGKHVAGATAEDGTTTYTLESDSTGPTSWDDVDDDTDVSEIVSEETAEALADSTVTAKEIAAWATHNGVDFAAGILIPVDALILNCGPAQNAIAEAKDAVVVDEKTMDAIMAAVAAGTDPTNIEIPAEVKAKYPMATIKLVPSTKLESTDTAKFFQLQLKLK